MTKNKKYLSSMNELIFSHDIFPEHLQTAADRLALAARSPATLRAYRTN